jgi:predicted nucleic acid-binding protein
MWIEPQAAHVVIVCDVTPVEMISLLTRRQRERTISAHNASLLESDFFVHLAMEYLVAPITSDVLVKARALVKKHGLRTLDAIQLACAAQTAHILAEALTFVSADRNLLAAAALEGFAVDDPNAHP